MLVTVKGLVLRENIVNENARYINIMTDSLGKISVLVRGSVRLRGRFTAATGIFSYSEFVLYEHTGKYTLNECTVIERYFKLSEDFDRMTLATYILNAVEYVTSEQLPEPEILRLALNTLWAMTKFPEKDLRLIKGTFELRLAALAGFSPNVAYCNICGHGVEESPMLLNVMGGRLTCRECAKKVHNELHIENDIIVDSMNTAQIIIPLSPAVVLAMQHALYAQMSKLFSFTLAPELLAEYRMACEKYFLNHIDHHFDVLDMLDM